MSLAGPLDEVLSCAVWFPKEQLLSLARPFDQAPLPPQGDKKSCRGKECLSDGFTRVCLYDPGRITALRLQVLVLKSS